jgi:hypothetical protein
MLRAFMYDRQHDIILLMQEDQNTKYKKTRAKIQAYSGPDSTERQCRNMKVHGRTVSPPVCWADKASRAIFASQSGNIGLL